MCPPPPLCPRSAGWFLDCLGVYVCAAVPPQWTPQAHAQFPADFKRGVRAVLLCAHRLASEEQSRPCGDDQGQAPAPLDTHLGRLPADVLGRVFQALNAMAYHEFTTLGQAGYSPIVWQVGAGEAEPPRRRRGH